MNAQENILDYDLTQAKSKNRLLGVWRMMSGYRLRYLFAILSQGVSTASKTGVYLLLSWFIDSWLTQKDRSIPIFLVAASFILLALIEGLFSYSANSIANFIAEKMAYRIRNNMFDQIQRLSFSYHAKTDTGDLIQRATSDVDSIRRFFSEQAIGIGRIFFLYTINFAAIYRIHPMLAYSTLIIVPVVLITAIFFFRYIGKKYERYQNQDAVLSTTLQENLSGVSVVKAFARQDYETQKFERENWKKYLLGKNLLLTEAFFWPSTDLLCGIQMAISFLMGAFYTIDGKITLGNFIAFLALIIWIIWPIRNMGRLIVQMSRALISFRRVMDVFKEDKEPLDQGSIFPVDAPKGSIEFENVGFSYQTGNETLEAISFTVVPGQVIAIIGSTGSGKTTLVNLLPRFYDYTSGSIRLDGAELNQIPRSYLRNHIGIVEQEPFLFSRTIGENIAYGVNRKISRSEIENAAKAAAIHESILSFEKGYDTMVGERGVTLSGGQKQRIAIARVLLKNPRILIMDDATSSIDTDTEAEIRNCLNHLMKNRTTFIIAHRIQSILNADLILVMDKGKIVQAGTHQELSKQEGLYQKIFTIQTQIEEELAKEISGD
ncbi:MAG: ABC transporter ATP-binding protein [Flexilinea sp.]